ncbi:MAG: F-type H+-transporting ATPase subunit b [Pirellulaceae bacterium]
MILKTRKGAGMLLHSFRNASTLLACGLLIVGVLGANCVQAQEAAPPATTEVGTQDTAEGEPPAPEEPATDTPATETPVVETPVVETPVVETPVVETPVVETPVVETPVVETPVVETPAPEEPATDTPVVETPATDTPVVDTSATEASVGAEGEGAKGDGPAEHVAEGHVAEGHVAEGHVAGGHDNHDNSHSNATSDLLVPSEARADLAIWTFLVFAMVLLLLGWFAWGPIVAALDAREDSIAKMIEQAQLDAKQAEKQLQAYDQKLAQAAEDAREIVAQARKDAEVRGAELMVQAREDGDRLIERAKAEIDTAKSLAIQELAEASVNSAVSLAGQMIRREIKPGDHSQIIRDAIDKFPSKN